MISFSPIFFRKFLKSSDLEVLNSDKITQTSESSVGESSIREGDSTQRRLTR
ncbi:hypothetical protein SBRY_21110 [Actinacidiphila bryophytorum]|uniref:Uncharacterized protein n=1 Tax=Actinacidiphila bryophytorum TaxID=1436133 RepID=A0A9W4EDR2_9ACTN|nr:hypothetical protein SBRY_21110 [Actinacidiphila bryophytorum]